MEFDGNYYLNFFINGMVQGIVGFSIMIDGLE